jgi:hypothetical protein
MRLISLISLAVCGGAFADKVKTEEIYRMHCAACHGASFDSSGDPCRSGHLDTLAHYSSGFFSQNVCLTRKILSMEGKY